MANSDSPENNAPNDAFRYRDFLAPKYWPLLLGIALLRLIALLPMPILSVFGWTIGSVCYLVLFRRRKIALKNIQLCFPELSASQCKLINFKHYCLLGQAIVTGPINWWASKARFMRLANIKGREHYDAALKDNRNIILLAPHFMAMEASGLALQTERPMIGMYQYMKNPLMNKLALERRQRFCTGGIMVERKRSPLRSILRALNKGMPMQYSPDQDAGRKGVFVPFFHQLASTTPALGKFAQACNAVVIPVSSTYRPWGMGFDVELGAPIEQFPSGDELADTTVMNRSMEQLIRKHPEQYLWAHKRFKTRKDGETSFYKGL